MPWHCEFIFDCPSSIFRPSFWYLFPFFKCRKRRLWCITIGTFLNLLFILQSICFYGTLSVHTKREVSVLISKKTIKAIPILTLSWNSPLGSGPLSFLFQVIFGRGYPLASHTSVILFPEWACISAGLSGLKVGGAVKQSFILRMNSTIFQFNLLFFIFQIDKCGRRWF